MTTLSEFSCDCEQLPDGFPCSDCYIKKGVEFDE